MIYPLPFLGRDSSHIRAAALMSAGTHRPLLRYARQLRRRQKGHSRGMLPGAWDDGHIFSHRDADRPHRVRERRLW